MFGAMQTQKHASSFQNGERAAGDADGAEDDDDDDVDAPATADESSTATPAVASGKQSVFIGNCFGRGKKD